MRVQYDAHEQGDHRLCGVCALLAEIDALRARVTELEAQVATVRAEERERCRLIAKMGHEEECDCLVCYEVAKAIRALPAGEDRA